MKIMPICAYRWAFHTVKMLAMSQHMVDFSLYGADDYGGMRRAAPLLGGADNLNDYRLLRDWNVKKDLIFGLFTFYSIAKNNCLLGQSQNVYSVTHTNLAEDIYSRKV